MAVVEVWPDSVYSAEAYKLTVEAGRDDNTVEINMRAGCTVLDFQYKYVSDISVTV